MFYDVLLAIWRLLIQTRGSEEPSYPKFPAAIAPSWCKERRSTPQWKHSWDIQLDKLDVNQIFGNMLIEIHKLNTAKKTFNERKGLLENRVFSNPLIFSFRLWLFIYSISFSDMTSTPVEGRPWLGPSHGHHDWPPFTTAILGDPPRCIPQNKRPGRAQTVTGMEVKNPPNVVYIWDRYGNKMACM